MTRITHTRNIALGVLLFKTCNSFIHGDKRLFQWIGKKKAIAFFVCGWNVTIVHICEISVNACASVCLWKAKTFQWLLSVAWQLISIEYYIAWHVVSRRRKKKRFYRNQSECWPKIFRSFVECKYHIVWMIGIDIDFEFSSQAKIQHNIAFRMLDWIWGIFGWFECVCVCVTSYM